MSENTDDFEEQEDELVVDEYYRRFDELSKKYPKVAVFMQVGKFFELYCANDFSKSNARELTKLMNCELKPKDPRRTDSPLMGGFPLPSLDKNIQRLVDLDFTVVVYEQFSKDEPENSKKGSRKIRKITQVVSKGTNMDSDRIRTNIICIYCKEFSKDLYLFALAVCDSTVSHTIFYEEIQSSVNDKGKAMDSAIRFLSQYEPVECVIVTENGYQPNIIKNLTIKCPIITRDVQTLNETDYDDTFNRPVNYAISGIKTFLDDHGIELQDIHIFPHESSNHMELCSNAINQLDIPLLFEKIEFNKTLTAMGDRLIRTRITNPIVCREELNDRYDKIDNLTENSVSKIREKFKQIPDISKYHMRMSLGKLSWTQMSLLNNSYILVYDIVPPALQSCLKEFSKDIKDSLIFENESFVEGKHENLDEIVNGIKEAENEIETFKKIFIETNKKVKMADIKIKDGSFITTKTRADAVCKLPEWEQMTVGKTIMVYTKKLRNFINTLTSATNEYERIRSEYFSLYQKEFYEKHHEKLDIITKNIAELDVSQCAWTLAKSRRMCRPKISDDLCIKVDELRHILIEIINPGVKYIENDLALTSEEGKGILLYGVNGCGKTSLLKSLGLALVFAQAGLFVPASAFEYSPLKRIITRIAGGDNIERSQSSFMVEMEELQSIIRRADEHTLILGDEMCRGTEVESATGIVTASLEWLTSTKSYFVAATHLHNIAGYVAENGNIQVKHMEVQFDDNGEVVYERKLQQGQGRKMYGLEILKQMNFPKAFVRLCSLNRNKVRKGKSNSPRKEKISKYNSKKVLVKCENPSCGYEPEGEYDLPLETHHIEFQCNADDDGFHGNQHKHALHNLIGLCKICHQKVHSRKLKITLKQTLDGQKPVFSTIGTSKT